MIGTISAPFLEMNNFKGFCMCRNLEQAASAGMRDKLAIGEKAHMIRHAMLL